MKIEESTTPQVRRSGIKCVVWDLDETLWRGVLLEGGATELRPGIDGIVKELDRRGILQSLASRNEFRPAWSRLTALGLQDYFLCPQICWAAKSESLSAISRELGVALDAIAFIDDDAHERAEVSWCLPQVLVIDAADTGQLLDMRDVQPTVITPDSRLRRIIYRASIERQRAEREFRGDRQSFLESLRETVTIRPASEADLLRAEELTVRTNQLNTTGRTYSLAELTQLLASGSYEVLVADFEDRFGSAGTVGLALIGTGPSIWRIELLIASCRVLSRGLGGIMLSHILLSARQSRVRVQAEFVETGRNRLMYMTYKMHGFYELTESAQVVLLQHDLVDIRPFPSHVMIRTGACLESQSD